MRWNVRMNIIKKKSRLSDEQNLLVVFGEHFRSRKIMDSDDLGLVLRCHFLIEAILEQILMKYIKDKSIFYEKDFSFFLKVKLAKSMDLIPERTFIAINRLNNIRNIFAHNINTRLDEIDLSAITKGFLKKEESKPRILSSKKWSLMYSFRNLFNELRGILETKAMGD